MEKPKRLAPLDETLRRLYTLSGNQCAFPGCYVSMFNREGNFVGQICHIEAAMPGGERFNPTMTNEQRRAFDNLMLMCYAHHIETNKVSQYSTAVLKNMKIEHESVFSDIGQLVRSMQSSYSDVTSDVNIFAASSLVNLNVGVFGKDNRDPDDVLYEVREFNDGIQDFASLSPDAKKIFAIALSRANYDKNIYGRINGNIYFDPNEVLRVTGIRYNDLRSIIFEIENAGFLTADENSDGREYPFFRYQNSEVNFWLLIKDFCRNKNLDVIDIVSNMKFSIFD